MYVASSLKIHKQSVASLICDKKFINSEVTFDGWVKTRRDSKAGISFITVNDGSCFKSIQAIADNNLPNYSDEILKLTTGCSVEISGKLVESPARGQDVEVQVTSIKVHGWVDDPETYPVQPKRHSMEHLRQHAHLRPRTNIISALSRVRQTVANSIHNFFDRENFLWVNTPIITASDCEGAGEMFQVTTLDMENLPLNSQKQIDYQQDFFSTAAFLTVSGQLNAEAYAQALGKVYTFGPTFRAENSNTSRHLAEFWMVEPEVAFADLNDIALLAETLLRTVCKELLEKRADEIDFFNQHVDNTCLTRMKQLAASDFVRMSYTEAVEIIQNSGKKFEFPVAWGADLQSEHERFLAEEYLKSPVILTDYPKQIKAFYMRDNDDEKTVAAMDVLVPGIGEIIGGSQREERFDILKAKMEKQKLDLQALQWYLDLRRYGTVVHSGFGLGFERLLSYMTGIANVRDVIPFPRVPRNVNF
ncbi:MAG: asparagine--tRNA ligase [Endozoicomonadaceae bacterium]|nr:asparagine--tRNA ligase [Endozoicomonadaceae bacterium]